MREIVLDTETTGLDPNGGHRIVEIGCVELINRLPTGQVFHVYINPERDIPEDALRVHGITSEFLADKPRFAEIAEDFLAFIAGDPLIIHNAAFDIGFLNAELQRLKHPPLPMERSIDTVQIARKRFPGAQASLDALCRRFEIDLSGRDLHGALLDCRLLAEVYLELHGGRQPGLELARERAQAVVAAVPAAERRRREPRPHAPSETELAAHARLLEKLKEPLWRQ
ncbi:DNA polymerase-3 subunit epsilon [Tistlia consotensis]|uniref:DNA polymerase III subunit epsilon n=1 Tax=Tistlia consotensis USBA 355 TaxID=560819 RepID=A0A1Y6BFT3_9PROT|nr:DNA polymerase III subunit epsilon [Tistlia consotensis]SMF08946.1 DNA polymerase-3 subunit epsilon [Tistlia consotensis USBA 355]SNR34988.1 DNA polymerase-3 subunit epsilon [Tistlia consotensis]